MNHLHPFIWYLLKVALALTVVYLFYALFLRRLTFYKLNRSFLLTYVLFSFILPVLDISSFFAADKIEAIPVINTLPSLNQLWETPIQHRNQIEQLPLINTNNTEYFSWPFVIWIIFLAGLMMMIIRFFIQLISLYDIIRKAKPLVPPVPGIFTVPALVAPFSFINRAYINQASHTSAELDEIIAHERTHIEQKHYIDIFFMQLVSMVQWFNPFAWLLNRMMRENLEFLADEAVLNKGIDRKHYQYHLLRVTGANASYLSNQFNFSSLKTRIRMMNKNQTHKIQLIRLLILLPVTVVILMAFRSVSKTDLVRRAINKPLVTNEIKKNDTIIRSGVQFLSYPSSPINGIIPSGTVYKWSAPTVSYTDTETVKERKDTIIPSGTVYRWSAPTVTGQLTNPLNTVQTATYTITQVSGPNSGQITTFTVTVTINPSPPIGPIAGLFGELEYGPGATNAEIQEYQSIVKSKCFRNKNGDADAHFNDFSESEKKKLAYFYGRMDEKQKENAVVIFWKERKPFYKVPIQEQLNDWLDANKFNIFIDGKEVENEVLKNYQPFHFAYYYQGPHTKKSATQPIQLITTRNFNYYESRYNPDSFGFLVRIINYEKLQELY
jgi:beta-lactamase regulating signal transducer with metallopeptidase domain